MLDRKSLARFDAKIDRSGRCWIWTAGKFSKGYGAFWVGGQTVRAHRISYQLHIGPIPEGLFVLHECDTPACVNPKHLFVGTQAKNMADMTAKGRRVVGEAHGMSKLTKGDVRSIRVGTDSQRACAVRYGVSQARISRIRRGESWVHVEV